MRYQATVISSVCGEPEYRAVAQPVFAAPESDEPVVERVGQDVADERGLVQRDGRLGTRRLRGLRDGAHAYHVHARRVVYEAPRGLVYERERERAHQAAAQSLKHSQVAPRRLLKIELRTSYPFN